MTLCLSLHLLLDPEEMPWKPCETWLKHALRRRHSLAKQLILRRWDFPLESLIIFLIRGRLVLHFLRWVKSCREIDWWSIPGWRFWRGWSSNGRSGASGISGLVHPSGTHDWRPGTSDWSPGTPDWSPGSSGRSLVISRRRCLSNGPGPGVWNWHSHVHPTLH